MKKEFIPYTLALSLKELGFDEPCFSYYKNDQLSEILEEVINSKMRNVNNEIDDYISAPTFSQAFRWFREKYGYFTSPTESDDDTFKKYDWLITKNLGKGKMFINFIGYKNSYEQAQLECLKKLIEIVKKNE
jgi:hypothetical protein